MRTQGNSPSPPATTGAFDLSGGRPCLDFANTVEDRPGEARDRLATFEDLLSWAGEAGLVGEGMSAELRKAAAERPREAEGALSAAKALREALYGIFSSVAAGEAPEGPAVTLLNDALPEAMGDFRLAPAGPGHQWRWALSGAGLHGILATLVKDTAELLTSPEVGRIRECESETCAWLFLDQSRNRSRRWCDMSTCGNRAKARRHYQRSKAST
jgi:predicted RNA-binding Zn ribbon-like protein